jgi:hypothetical protein
MDNKAIKNIISYLIIASIFVTGEGFQIGIDAYWYYPVYILFLIFGVFAYHKMNWKIFSVIILVILFSLFTYKIELTLVIKQLVNVIFSAAVFYYFLCHESFDLTAIFSKYVKVAKVILIIGFVQVLVFLLGAGETFVNIFFFLKSYHVHDRLQSLTQEPSFIAITFAPIIFFSLYNILHRTELFLSRRWSYWFIVGYLLTQSSIAYTGLICCGILIYFKDFSPKKLQYFLFAAGGIVLIALGFYNFNESVKIRIDDTLYALNKNITEPNVYRSVNYSTYALLTNYYVTSESLKEHPITGHGLGTHEAVYDRHIPDHMKNYYVINRQDASSMVLRLLSETGLVGLLTFCLFTIAFKLKSRRDFNENELMLWLINSGIFIIILLALFRNGNYTVHGKILFFLMYYYSYIFAKALRRRDRLVGVPQ